MRTLIIAKLIYSIQPFQSFLAQNMNTSTESISKRQKRLHGQARQLAFRYMSNMVYSRRKFMEPCLIPVSSNFIHIHTFLVHQP
jgi:hypothetical protein